MCYLRVTFRKEMRMQIRATLRHADVISFRHIGICPRHLFKSFLIDLQAMDQHVR